MHRDIKKERMNLNSGENQQNAFFVNLVACFVMLICLSEYFDTIVEIHMLILDVCV